MSTSVPAARDEWWRSAVAYQVYPRSFADSNGDGIGDIPGIIGRLDHIAGLGVDVIWLSPVYRSPQDDNGYDISDYRDVDPQFGTLADLDELIAQLHRRGMKLVMDLVVNHTSDEHEWFVESRSSRDNPRADWYVWRDPRPGHVGGEPGAEPNNWESYFAGPTWEWVPERQQYYLHLFSKKQPDLNWENPEVRRAVYEMMTWWLDRGIDGFRMDVINMISKVPGLPDGEILASGLGDGKPFYIGGPRLEEFLTEMRQSVFDPRDGVCMTVGETPGMTVEQAARITDADQGSLSMVFQFEHMGVDRADDKFASPLGPVSLPALREILVRWQEGIGTRGWNSLYWSNHDQPRPVSRFGDDEAHWYESSTALAVVMHLQRGTPFVYQGEEIGMTNIRFDAIEQFDDIELLGYYRTAIGLGRDHDELIAQFNRHGRDNSRTPVQWDDSAHAGFTTGTPWLTINPNYPTINAAAQVGVAGSVYEFYRELIALRHRELALTAGEFRALLGEDPDLFAYLRAAEGSRLLVIANLSGAPRDWPGAELADAGAAVEAGAEVLLDNHPGRAATEGLRPWEARVVRIG